MIRINLLESAKGKNKRAGGSSSPVMPASEVDCGADASGGAEEPRTQRRESALPRTPDPGQQLQTASGRNRFAARGTSWSGQSAGHAGRDSEWKGSGLG